MRAGGGAVGGRCGVGFLSWAAGGRRTGPRGLWGGARGYGVRGTMRSDAMAYWLMKTEPSEFSFADLAAQKKAVWDGVSNAAALQNLRAMKVGDEVLIYHTGKEKAVVGRATVSKAAYQ